MTFWRRNPSWVLGRAYSWGFTSQLASAAANFGLSWMAARILGPGGLGEVFIGFSAYLVVLGLQRSLLTDPLVARSSTLAAAARTAATRAALTVALMLAAAAAAAIAVVGLLVPGSIGRGLLLVSPWLGPTLLQDFWRMALFRDDRGGAGAANDLSWLATMVVMAPAAFLIRSEWAVIGCWGAGATVAMVVGFAQTGIRPERVIRAVRWWQSTAWPLGRWLGAESLVYALGSQALTFVLAAVLNTQAVGGIRSVQSVFAPLSVIGPALALPGLPAITRRNVVSVTGARRLAAGLGAIAAVLTVGYVMVAVVGGSRLLGFVFGSSFRSFEPLVWPIGLREILVAPTLGFPLLLRAQGRGRALLAGRTIASVVTLTLGTVLAVRDGVIGAAWGIATGAALGALILMGFALTGPAAPVAEPTRG
jgi:O-antigen/teichoic acid export membrane protein